MNKVLSIHIYPIKSLGGIALQSTHASPTGLEHDRRWMLVDEDNKFMTQRTLSKLCLFNQSIEEDHILVCYKDDEIRVPLNQKEGKLEETMIWEDKTRGFEVDPNVSNWFAERLEMKCRLLKMNDQSYRLNETKGDLKMNLSDGYPFLFIGSASLEFLNTKLEQPVPMNQFRPNIVLSTSEAHEEDTLENFNLGTAAFKGSHPCARCVVTTIDQQTALASKEPLRTMATYRKVDSRVNFGMNVFCTREGIIKVGDTIGRV